MLELAHLIYLCAYDMALSKRKQISLDYSPLLSETTTTYPSMSSVSIFRNIQAPLQLPPPVPESFEAPFRFDYAVPRIPEAATVYRAGSAVVDDCNIAFMSEGCFRTSDSYCSGTPQLFPRIDPMFPYSIKNFFLCSRWLDTPISFLYAKSYQCCDSPKHSWGNCLCSMPLCALDCTYKVTTCPLRIVACGAGCCCDACAPCSRLSVCRDNCCCGLCQPQTTSFDQKCLDIVRRSLTEKNLAEVVSQMEGTTTYARDEIVSKCGQDILSLVFSTNEEKVTLHQKKQIIIDVTWRGLSVLHHVLDAVQIHLSNELLKFFLDQIQNQIEVYRNRPNSLFDARQVLDDKQVNDALMKIFTRLSFREFIERAAMLKNSGVLLISFFENKIKIINLMHRVTDFFKPATILPTPVAAIVTKYLEPEWKEEKISSYNFKRRR